MLTTDQIRDMTPEQLGAKLSELATEYYGTAKFAPRLAHDMIVTPPTVYNWMKGTGSAQIVIMLLQERLTDPRGTREFDRRVNEVKSAMAQLSRVFLRAGDAINELGAVLPDVPAQPRSAEADDEPLAQSTTSG